MSEAATPSGWDDAASVALLFALDPVRLGGVALRGPPGLVRDRWLALLSAALPAGTRLRRVPLGIADERLLGGLDLAATLAAGRPVRQRGLLEEAAGGVVLLAMAERLAPATAGRLVAALDGPAAPGCVALDEGAGEDERPPTALLDRLAFLLDLDSVSLGELTPLPDVSGIAEARRRLPSVRLDAAIADALCATSVALGVASLRPVLLALAVARAAAAWQGRDNVTPADAILAGRLVLAPRATRLPAAEAPTPGDPADAGARDPAPSADSDDNAQPGNGGELSDMLVAAAQAAIPAGLLAMLGPRQAGAARVRASAGRMGAAQKSRLRGRPIGARPGMPRDGARLDLLETLRAAAPWQKLRRAEGGSAPLLAVRRADFRVIRRSERRQTTTIFVVDASGSAALQRLAEAKGAVELLLAECYVRRDEVALFAFRGRTSQLLLPPTRSLVRARRSLSGLPGGGGTPLAAGLDAGLLLAEAVRRRGGTPTLVLLTDGRGNIARDGTPGRARAMQEAQAAARQILAAGVAAVLVDTSPRPDPAARGLAGAMGARYLPLPYADSAALARAVAA